MGRSQIFKFSILFLRREERQNQSQVPFGFSFCVFVFFNVKKIFYVCICLENESSSHGSSKFRNKQLLDWKKQTIQ